LGQLAYSLKNGLLGAGKCKILLAGAAMRKLIHIVYGVLETSTPFDRNSSAATALDSRRYLTPVYVTPIFMRSPYDNTGA
jgi:hypothetical protein